MLHQSLLHCVLFRQWGTSRLCVQFRHRIFFWEISTPSCLRSPACGVAGEALAWPAPQTHPGSGLDAPPALPCSSTLPYPFVMQHVMGTAFGWHTECYRLVHGGEGDGDGILPQDCELHLFIHLQIKKSAHVDLCAKHRSFLAWSWDV